MKDFEMGKQDYELLYLVYSFHLSLSFIFSNYVTKLFSENW